MSSPTVDAAGQMRGWFKLIETIRKTDPPSNELIKSPPNSSLTISINTNGHISKSPDRNNIDSPPQQTSPFAIIPISIQAFDEPPVTNVELKPKSTGAKRTSSRHKKITIRKSTKSKELLTLNNTPDDETTHQRKRPSIDSSTNLSSTPLATDLQSLPGYHQDELRDQRFLDYSDIKTLTMHLNTCLAIDKKSFSSSSLTKQHIFKTRHNILNKIFKLNFLKTSQKSSSDNQKEETKANPSLSISNVFKTDWSVNRRSSSTHRHKPKNLFHILQLNPKKELSLLPLAPSKLSTEILSEEDQQNNHYEHIKTLLVRTYYPHFHTAIQHGHFFGSNSKLLKKNHVPSVVINPPSFTDIDETMTINLNSPLSTPLRESKRHGHKGKHRTSKDKPLPIISTKRRVSEEIPPVDVLTPTQISSPPLFIEKEVNNNNYDNRKRKTSITMYSNLNERKKKKIEPVLSPELIDERQNVSYSDSDDDILPDELPKQNFIKNGLRSNFYKSANDTDLKSINRPLRRRQQSSGSLPPFYTGLFQSEDEKFSYIDYQLPYDIYWFSQKRVNLIHSPSKSTNQNKKKKSSQSKQKQTLPNRRIIRNTPILENVLSSPSNNTKKPINKDFIKMEELTEHEKEIISQTSIFLKRNLRRIKEQNESKDKNNNQQKHHVEEQPLPLFFPQNYYHPNETTSLTENINVSHRDLLNLFYNHIRRSHFGKTGQYALELIDKTCYYAQLAQLTLILNDIFDFLLNYKCQNSDIYPSNALKKCPLKRLFPMYYEIISKPIDLSIISNKLDNGEYFSYDSFEQDVLLLFTNAITYCGEDSDVGRAVRELEIYFLRTLKIEYEPTVHLFDHMDEEDKNERNLKIFKDFITRFHAKEVINGQIRESLYESIFNVDQLLPVVYKTATTNATNTHRTSKNIRTNGFIIHCRCGSVYEETLLVQCYACQLWQHVTCVKISDFSRPYFCFECHPLCEQNSSACLKSNVRISEDHQSCYLTITRSDGFIIRINECYIVSKQEETSTSSDYDLFFIERLYIDENNIEKASGFYYLRPYETFHEVNRKFFSNEVFRFPSTNDSIEIKSILRPCYVLDTTTFCKGKPIAELTSRILPTDLFICEYRVDKLARIFTRLPKSKHIGMNTKTYCFDNYIEKLTVKRDYQPHQKEYYHQQQTSRRRSSTHPSKLTAKQLEEKSSHIDGIIEKIYCRFHHPTLIPSETKFTPNQFFQQEPITEDHTHGRKRLRNKNPATTSLVKRKRRTRSVSSNESLSDNNHQPIIVSLLDELIESISSYIV